MSAAMPIAVQMGWRMRSSPASSWTTSWILSNSSLRPSRSWNHQPVSAASRPLPQAMIPDVARDCPLRRPMASSPAKIAGQTRLPHIRDAIIERAAGIEHPRDVCHRRRERGAYHSCERINHRNARHQAGPGQGRIMVPHPHTVRRCSDAFREKRRRGGGRRIHFCLQRLFPQKAGRNKWNIMRRPPKEAVCHRSRRGPDSRLAGFCGTP